MFKVNKTQVDKPLSKKVQKIAQQASDGYVKQNDLGYNEKNFYI